MNKEYNEYLCLSRVALEYVIVNVPGLTKFIFRLRRATAWFEVVHVFDSYMYNSYKCDGTGWYLHLKIAIMAFISFKRYLK